MTPEPPDDLFARMQAAMDASEPNAGFGPEDLIDLPDDLRRLVQWIARRGDVAAADAAEGLGLSVDDAKRLLADLEAKGFAQSVDAAGVRRYNARFGQRRSREVPIDLWALLDDRTGG